MGIAILRGHKCTVWFLVVLYVIQICSVDLEEELSTELDTEHVHNGMINDFPNNDGKDISIEMAIKVEFGSNVKEAGRLRRALSAVQRHREMRVPRAELEDDDGVHIGPGAVVGMMVKCKGGRAGKHMLVVFAVDSCTNSTAGHIYSISVEDSASETHFVHGRVMLLKPDGRDHIAWRSGSFASAVLKKVPVSQVQVLNPDVGACHMQVCASDPSSNGLAGGSYRFEVKQLNELACSYDIGEGNHDLPAVGSAGRLPYTNEAGDEIGVVEVHNCKTPGEMIVEELKFALKDLGLPTGGKKAELQNRLEEAQDKQCPSGSA